MFARALRIWGHEEYEEELTMPTQLGYYYELDPYCIDCGRRLKQSYIDSDSQQSHYHITGTGPICRRCVFHNSQTEHGSTLAYEDVFRNDDDEVYDD